MAHYTHGRSAVSEFGGKHHRDQRLMPDATAGTCYSEQQHSTKDTAPMNNNHTERRGNEQSTAEEDADEEDSSVAQDDEQAEEEDEQDVIAPFHRFGNGGKGKGKRPSIRIEPVEDDESPKEDDDTTTSGTGLIPSKHPVNQLLMNNKKRTFSNLSSTSVLFGDDLTEHESFPRRKLARKLSNVAAQPLLIYQESAEAHSGFENAIETDDEDYSGVNLIPDDDESDIDEQEESFIINEQEQATNLLNEYRDARRLSLDSCVSDDIFRVTAPLDEAYLSALQDYGFAQFFEPDALPASPDPAAKRKYSDSSTKRVHFDDEVQASDDSSSESSELDSSVFPDLFLEQDKLPPILHQLMEIDNEDDNGDVGSPMSDASFWDFGQEESRITQAEDSDDESSAGSSGYETDMGDTTDEDEDLSDAQPRTPLQKKSVLRQPSSAPGSRAATPKPFQRNSRPTGRQIPPTRGIFIHEDSTKAIAVTNRATKTVTFYRPRTNMIPWLPINAAHSSTSSTSNNSPRTSLVQLNVSDSELSNEVFNNGFNADIMLTGMSGFAQGNEYFFGNESIGPPEAFYPFVSIGSNGHMDIMDEEDDDSDDFEDDMKLDDFLDFGSGGEDTDVEHDDEDTEAPTTPATAKAALHDFTSAPPTPSGETPVVRKRTTSDVMAEHLEHFDRGVVTAFRNNQNLYRDIASLPSDPTARASASRPVRSGKSAETLITPLRKRSKSNRVAKSPYAPSTFTNHSSPLGGVNKANSRLQNSVMDSPRAPPPRMGTFS